MITTTKPESAGPPSPPVSRLPFLALRFTRVVNAEPVHDERRDPSLRVAAPTEFELLDPPQKKKCVNLKAWKVECTLANWRWSLQVALSIAISALPSRIRVLDGFFAGNSRWIVPAACTVIEKTAGASTLRMFDRLIGTAIAGLWIAACFLIVIGASTPHTLRDASYFILAPLWALCTSIAFFAGWIRYRWPTHPIMAVTAIYTAPILLGAGLSTGNPFHQCLWRTICALVGVIVSGCVTRWFLPRRARSDITEGLAEIIEQLSRTLEPLIELESGLVSSASFFTDKRDSTSDVSWMSPEAFKSDSTTPLGRVMVDYEAWQQFKSKLWDQLESCGRLTSAQLAMMSAAKNEFSLRSSTSFKAKEHQEALIHIRTMFYHVTSLFTLIDTQVGGGSRLADDELFSEVEYWSRFGMVSIQNHYDANATKVIRQKTTQSTLQPPKDNIADLSTRTYSSAAPGDAAGNWTNQLPSTVDIMEADVGPTLRWARLYGPTIGSMTRHICAALRAAASGLRSNEIPTRVPVFMSRAGQAIHLFHKQRDERRQATAACVDFVLCRTDTSSPQLTSAQLESFERVIGMTVPEYRALTPVGRDIFWSTYWLLRDRLSTTDTTVMTLFVAVSQALAAIKQLIETRISRIQKGERLRDTVDADRLEMAGQVAITKAGGHATDYKVDQLN